MIDRYGWSRTLAAAFAPLADAGLVPARVVAQHRDGYLVVAEAGEVRAKASGRLIRDGGETGQAAVGDWVGLAGKPGKDAATLEAILPRRTVFVRRAAHSAQRAQVVAANIEVVLIVAALNDDPNLRRIERYLAAASQSGARPVLVLTKSDLCGDPEAERARVAAVAAGVPAVMVSAKAGGGLDDLLAQIRPGETCVLVGSSGVGKSTLVNALLGEERMATNAVREADQRGRHTTSHRELVLLPGGGLLLDTPGMREFGLIEADEGVGAVFEDIERLARACRFRDCSHEGEPGCAVAGALDSGALAAPRWAHFRKLGQELAEQEDRADRAAREAERRREAALQKTYRAKRKDYRGGR